jgi:hypothetical protein
VKSKEITYKDHIPCSLLIASTDASAAGLRGGKKKHRDAEK